METGRVLHGRYLLQRLVKQTAFCVVHQGMDQRLQRAVAVKTVLAPENMAYRTAIRMTANFSHPHIIGLYDLVIEPDSLYMIEEYVEGETFEQLAQNQLSAYEIAELGWQICLALMYTGSSSRRVCHGDLTPVSVMRDHQGVARINNFALQTDLAYFQKWSILGGEGIALLEEELPWGQQSEARKADDIRAVGLLLYQLLTSSLEPPPDGRLRFARGTPPEMCELIARTIVRQHPQNITSAELLYTQLKSLSESLEPPLPAPNPVAGYQQEEPLVRQYSSAGVGKIGPALSARDIERGGRSLSSYSGKLPSLDMQFASPVPTDAPYAQPGPPLDAFPKGGNSPALMILLLGLMAFILFFAIGYFLGHALIH